MTQPRRRTRAIGGRTSTGVLGTGRRLVLGRHPVHEGRPLGLEWIARHGLTGILSEYEVGGGCYDLAVRQGLPSGTPNLTMDQPVTSLASRPAWVVSTYAMGNTMADRPRRSDSRLDVRGW
jgi:hypothetical protein